MVSFWFAREIAEREREDSSANGGRQQSSRSGGIPVSRGAGRCRTNSEKREDERKEEYRERTRGKRGTYGGVRRIECVCVFVCVERWGWDEKGEGERMWTDARSRFVCVDVDVHVDVCGVTDGGEDDAARIDAAQCTVDNGAPAEGAACSGWRGADAGRDAYRHHRHQ